MICKIYLLYALLWGAKAIRWWQVPPLLSRHSQETRITSVEHLKQAVQDARLSEAQDRAGGEDVEAYTSLLDAIDVMQDHFFAIPHGVWPDAIDWTSAVMGTHVSATIAALCDSAFSKDQKHNIGEDDDHENLINRYFTQLLAFYSGENAFGLRNQAYDDMLWVVLDWLQAIQFVEQHAAIFESKSSSMKKDNNSRWYGRQFVPQFAHRARIFYDLASAGWDETLCGGGMLWSPYTSPYKNAITNELYIAASISMYLHFPGDKNDGPFIIATDLDQKSMPPAKAKDEKYLNNALKAYDWLKSSGMTNSQGLFVDGFHIAGWRRGRSNGTGECDLRNEMVYTYNQGVILTGQRGLWQATGEIGYLEDGHRLIRDVIAATGWAGRDKPGRWRWAGMGRNGVLEDICDWSGSCSQNGQTFKGIFFHHFSVFCTPLPTSRGESGAAWFADSKVQEWHSRQCTTYRKWVVRNKRAATVTKDANGEFGQWWGRPADGEASDDQQLIGEEPISEGIDYRNVGVPDDDTWQPEEPNEPPQVERDMWGSQPLASVIRPGKHARDHDVNDRGRGRTVETQSGGLSVVRAAWKFLRQSGRQKGSVYDDL